jgi:N-acetylglucosaminyldiphosphoundecaprenol N-acetyl-beta-D-mannosaminyltransferase
VITHADLVTADGIGIRWASAFLRTVEARGKRRRDVLVWFIRTLGAFFLKPQTIPSPIPERVSGSDLLWDIAQEAAAARATVYLIGGRRQTALRAAEHLQKALPNLTIAVFAPDHVATPYPPYELHVALETKAPAVVFIGYGAPQQEEWIHQNLHRFPSIRIAMGVGGALDFLAGNAPRAPFQYQVRGLEWFWRLEHQPRRILRALRATILFPTILLLSRLRMFP